MRWYIGEVREAKGAEQGTPDPLIRWEDHCRTLATLQDKLAEYRVEVARLLGERDKEATK